MQRPGNVGVTVEANVLAEPRTKASRTKGPKRQDMGDLSHQLRALGVEHNLSCCKQKTSPGGVEAAEIFQTQRPPRLRVSLLFPVVWFHTRGDLPLIAIITASH